MSLESPTWPASDAAKQFVQDSIVIDSLMSSTLEKEHLFEEYHDRGLSAGVTTTGLTVAISPGDYDDTSMRVSRFLRHIMPADRFMLVRKAEDIRRANAENKHGFYFQAQSSECLNNQPDVYLPLLKSLGMGTLLLAYNERVRAGDGCFVIPEWQLPLSAYGKTIVDACHKYGVAVDTSHTSEVTALSAIEYSQEVAPDVPVIETHTAPAAMYDSPPDEKRVRVISDERIKAIAATGGTIGIVMLPCLLIAPAAPGLRPEDVVDRVDYIRDLVGIEHVALASDDTYEWTSLYERTKKHMHMYDDGGLTVQALKVSSMEIGEMSKICGAVVDEMWRRDYSDEDIALVLGGNLLRVYERIWG